MAVTVTTSILFTDLVASTELGVHLSHEAAQELRNTHFALLRDAIEATGGHEVKNLGDGLMVAYASSTGVLDGAVAMLQRLERHNRNAAVALDVRIGISHGDATVEDGDFFGEPVVEAARLCDRAVGGQILLPDVLRHLARRSGHQFEPAGELSLKGLPEPVSAYALRWVPLEASPQQDLPTRLGVAPPAGLVGREEEQERLDASLKHLLAGEGPRTVLISGDPGIGKTALASYLSQSAHAARATVLYGRCDDELAVPYQPFVEALGALISNGPDETLAALDPLHLAELGRLVPQVRARLTDLPPATQSDPESERFLLFKAVAALLTEVAQRTPLVLVLDDLHWADESTVLLLRHLVTGLSPVAILVVGTFRGSDLSASHPFAAGLAALRREEGVDRISVGGLDDRGIVALLEGMAGHSIGDDGVELAHTVRRETGGNPFFTYEVLRHLVEIDALHQRADGRWEMTAELSEVGLPESVREVVAERVRRLGDEVSQILTVAAVIGRDFDLSLLARAGDWPEPAVLDALEAATERSVVAEVEGRVDRYTFTHALFQHTLYDELSGVRRSRLHRRIGELLEEDCGSEPGERIGELANHWVAAIKPSDCSKAVGFVCQAGNRALSSLAPHEAIRRFSQALALLDAEPASEATQRLDALIGLGDAQRQTGDPAYRETLLEAAAIAMRASDGARLVTAALVNSRGMVSTIGEVDPERIFVLEAARTVAGEADSPTLARLLASLAAEVSFSDDRARVRPLAEEAEAMARRLDDGLTLLHVLNVTFLARCVPDAYDDIQRRSVEAIEIADRLGDPVARSWAALNSVYAHTIALDPVAAEAALDTARIHAEAVDQPYLLWHTGYLTATHVLRAGDHERAEALAGQALQLATESGQPEAFACFGAGFLCVRRHQGRMDEIADLARQVVRDKPGLAALQGALALVLAECGELDEAREITATARESDFFVHRYDYVWLMGATVWADVVAQIGDLRSAEILYAQLAAYEDLGVTTGTSYGGVVSAYLARLDVLLERRDSALRLFVAADRSLRSAASPFWLCHNQVEWARCLLGTNDRTERMKARSILTEALSIAREFGCGGVERTAVALLDASAF